MTAHASERLPSERSSSQATLRRVLNGCLRFVSADRCALFLRRPECNAFRLGASIGLSEAYLEAVTRKWDGLPVARVFREPQFLFSPDVLADPACEAMRPEIRAEGFRSLAIVPLLSGEEPLGALGLYFDEARDLSAEDRTAMETFADLAAVAIESARNLEALRARSAQKEALRKVTRDLTEDLEPATVFSRICRSVCELLDVAFARLFVLDERADSLSRVAAHGRIELEKDAARVFPKGRGILWRVASQKEAVAVREVLTHPDW
ncbi:MAG: GAF domain-containing protein, partial [Nitrospinota bacterium]